MCCPPQSFWLIKEDFWSSVDSIELHSGCLFQSEISSSILWKHQGFNVSVLFTTKQTSPVLNSVCLIVQVARTFSYTDFFLVNIFRYLFLVNEIFNVKSERKKNRSCFILHLLKYMQISVYQKTVTRDTPPTHPVLPACQVMLYWAKFTVACHKGQVFDRIQQ